MPLYEYACEACGPFEVLRPVSAAAQPCACPSCGLVGRRLFSVPRVAQVSSLSRMAGDRNEKSRHEPRICSDGGCGHHHRKPAASAPTSGGPKRHVYNGPRPWVIEHR
jgi:putative FmdB family regulatory protein